MSNSLTLLNLMRANRLAGLWNCSRVASTTNSKVMKSSRKSSIAWAIVSDLPLNWSSKTRALWIASTLVASINPSTLLKQSNSKLLKALPRCYARRQLRELPGLLTWRHEQRSALRPAPPNTSHRRGAEERWKKLGASGHARAVVWDSACWRLRPQWGAPADRGLTIFRFLLRPTLGYDSDRPNGLSTLHCRRRNKYMTTGTVKWFNSTKGFGFIQPDNGGPDVFVHISAVERAGLSTLADGQKINYEIEQDRRTGKSSAGSLSKAG